MSNSLRMPFAEWLYRMAEDEVPYQARALAVYAACFDISKNDELSDLSGIQDRTFDRWKKYLSANGWVLIGAQQGGRGRGITVIPAYRETPVIFTDVSARNPRKFYTRNNEQTPATITPVIASKTPVEITPVMDKSAKITGVSRAEVSNNIFNNTNNLTTSLSLTEQETAREGELEIAPGLYKNCNTFRHRNFIIDVPAIELQVMGKNIPREKVVAFAEAQARQWSAEIRNGRLPSDVVPRAIARALSIGLTKEANFEEAHTHGMHLKTKAYTRPNKPSRY